MSADPNKKTPRTFQCRDVLWDTFQQMAQELECSVDYLVNEAMKQYARQRHGLRGPLSRPGDASAPPPAPGAGSVPPGHGAGLPPPPPPGRKSASLPPPPSARTSVAPQGRLPPPIGAPHPPPPPPIGGPAMSRGPAALSRGGPPPPPPPIAPPPPPPPPFSAGPGSPQKLRTAASSQQNYGGQLTAIYDGERVVVNKDRFVIGRGKQTSDLTIKDPNVSRQHAMVEFLNGQYYMVDMGSTNGVEHNGQRVTRRPIGEGDSYRICEHEIRFTYR